MSQTWEIFVRNDGKDYLFESFDNLKRHKLRRVRKR